LGVEVRVRQGHAARCDLLSSRSVFLSHHHIFPSSRTDTEPVLCIWWWFGAVAEGEESDEGSDDEIQAGGFVQTYKDPISLTMLEDPYTSFVHASLFPQLYPRGVLRLLRDWRSIRSFFPFSKIGRSALTRTLTRSSSNTSRENTKSVLCRVATSSSLLVRSRSVFPPLPLHVTLRTRRLDRH
jgi:hypothetical protein